MKKIIPFLLGAVFTPRLTAIAIEINSFCNRKCRYCPNFDHTRERAFLKDELFYKIIEELKQIRFKGRLTFNLYNEPLLDKRLLAFVRYIRKELPSVFIYLNTNGDLLDLALWRKLRKAGLDYTNVSQYDGKINSNIQRILNEISFDERKHLNVFILGLDYLCNRGGLVKKGDEAALPLKKRCFRPFSQLCVNYEGKVVLCCNDFLGLVVIGDLHKKSISAIWGSKIFRHYRRKLLFGDRAHLKLCNKCDMTGS